MASLTRAGASFPRNVCVSPPRHWGRGVAGSAGSWPSTRPPPSRSEISNARQTGGEVLRRPVRHNPRRGHRPTQVQWGGPVAPPGGASLQARSGTSPRFGREPSLGSLLPPLSGYGSHSLPLSLPKKGYSLQKEIRCGGTLPVLVGGGANLCSPTPGCFSLLCGGASPSYVACPSNTGSSQASPCEAGLSCTRCAATCAA